MDTARLGGLSGTLSQLASGGTYGGLGSNALRAVRIADEALSRLTVVEGRVDGFVNAALASASGLWDDVETDLTAALVLANGINEDAEELLVQKNRELASNAIVGLTLFRTQRLEIVNLLAVIAGLR